MMKTRRGRSTSTVTRKRLRDNLTKETMTTSSSDNETEACLFAFNKFDFNDVVLRLQIISDSSSEPAKMKTLHISSHFVAAKSLFFYKLLRNGMRESQHQNDDLSLTINAHEEEAVMDLINFMYENTLKATSSSDVVDVLVAADKFEVTSCMKYCVEMLLKLPMSQESAHVYLNLPSCVLVSELVRPITDASIQYLAQHFEDFIEFNKKATSELPLSIIEMILGSKGLKLTSEDTIFNFILKWARTSYPKLKERKKTITKHLIQFICFRNLGISKLKEALIYPDFDQRHVSKLVNEALFYNAEHPNGRDIDTEKGANTPIDVAKAYYSFSGRVYWPTCELYFRIPKSELKSLALWGRVISQTFLLGGKGLFLSTHRLLVGEQHHLGMFLNMHDKETIKFDNEYAVMNKSSMEYQIKWSSKNNIMVERGSGRHNLLGIEWTDFISDDSDYFINDVLHLRAKITLND